MVSSEIVKIQKPETLIYTYHSTAEWENQQTFSYNKSRLIYAEGGVLHVFTEENHWYLPGRCYMWIPANTPHSIVSNSAHVVLFSFFYRQEETESEFYQSMSIYLVNDLLREMIFYTEGWNGVIEQRDASKYFFMQAIKSILPEISSKIASYPVQHPYPKNKQLKEIAVYLNRNLSESLTLEEVAAKFGYSTRSLSRLFNVQLGMSYVKFLRAIRMAKALALMAEGKHNIYEIAIAVGYSSLSAFSNIFKRVTGTRPNEFIAKNKSK